MASLPGGQFPQELFQFFTAGGRDWQIINALQNNRGSGVLVPQHGAMKLLILFTPRRQFACKKIMRIEAPRSHATGAGSPKRNQSLGPAVGQGGQPRVSAIKIVSMPLEKLRCVSQFRPEKAPSLRMAARVQVSFNGFWKIFGNRWTGGAK